MALLQIKIPPSSDGYSVIIGGAAMDQILDGAIHTITPDKVKSSHLVNCQWIVDKAGYDYLQSFYRLVRSKPQNPFLCPLIIDTGDVLNYKCYIVQNSWSLSSIQGGVYTVSCQLEAWPIFNDAFDNDILMLRELDVT